MCKITIAGIMGLGVSIFGALAPVHAQTSMNHQATQTVGLMHVSTRVGSGILVEHSVNDLLLTDATFPRASYLLSISTRTSSQLTFGVPSYMPIVPCLHSIAPPPYGEDPAKRICTINLYRSRAIYAIVLRDL